MISSAYIRHEMNFPFGRPKGEGLCLSNSYVQIIQINIEQVRAKWAALSYTSQTIKEIGGFILDFDCTI